MAHVELNLSPPFLEGEALEALLAQLPPEEDHFHLPGAHDQSEHGNRVAATEISGTHASERWREVQIEAAVREYDPAPGGGRTYGDVTAEVDAPAFPLAELAKLPGLNDEHLRTDLLNDSKAKDLRETLTESIPIKYPIRIEVNHLGHAYIAEGNHRVARAVQVGHKTAPVHITYKASGERVPGQFNLDRFFVAPEQMTRADFHLPGQHDQKDHAPQPGSSDDPQRWRHDYIDVSQIKNTKHTPSDVHQLEPDFYNATPETIDELFGWAHLEELQLEQRKFESAHPGLIGVRVDAQMTGAPATIETLDDAIANDRVVADGPAAAAWVAANGREMIVPSAPPPVPLGRFKRCYDNALEFVTRHRGYKYCEGLVTDSKAKMAFSHAWAVGKDGTVVDPTMGWQPKAYYHGVTFPNARVVKAARAKSGDLLAITGQSMNWLKKELKL